MVREAEEFAEEDKKVKDRIDARNGLESYLYNLKNTLEMTRRVFVTTVLPERQEGAYRHELTDFGLDGRNPEADKEDYDGEAEGKLRMFANPLFAKPSTLREGGGGGGADADDFGDDEL
ncbi:Luminal-binding protein [Seminavis robusta]|uniref:Luminal-binding protein n=1 Tax=Seminavis robusta TaxID=568900 RepID=A0A9N8EW85_9STRA|nr:Luminal-binding protein [Seminavis robusta]|eukprot:Sro2463_g328370.1 Luminal-binding protein (119) ;mRNA; f:64-420